MAKVVRSEAVMSSERVKPRFSAIMARISMEIATVIPVGTENWRMFLMNLFLMRAVLGSRARMTPGRPMQAKFKILISRGA